MRTAHIIFMVICMTTVATAQSSMDEWENSSTTEPVRVDERRDVSATEEILIRNIAGSVRVVGTQGTELHVTGTIDKSHKLEIRRKDNKTQVEVVYPRKSSGDANIEVQLPRGCRVGVSTISADVDLSNVSGDVSIQSVSGIVKVPEGTATLEANTVSGDLQIASSTSKMSLKTVSGNILVQGSAGLIHGESVSGDIIVKAREIKQGSFTSISGTITFDGTLSDDGKLKISNHSGYSKLLLSSALSARVTLMTSTGDIESAFSESVSESLLQKKSEFTLGAGKGWIQVQSFSGDIKVAKK